MSKRGWPSLGVALEETPALEDEMTRLDVLHGDEYVGQIIYRRRKLPGGKGSAYGWQRAKAPRNSKLLTQRGAIEELIR